MDDRSVSPVPGTTPLPFEPDMSEEVAERRSGLRTGWTTGTCAAAAAKAAVTGLVAGRVPGRVDIALPDGRRIEFDVESPGTGAAIVVKDAGDDPDCTHGARMTAHASLSTPDSPEAVTMIAGDGVGTITKPGLGLPVGSPAINPVPRSMIVESIGEVTDLPVTVVFSVPGGEQMAERTTNDRLGIVGGISILGTTGVVKPFSTAAYRASVVQQIDVAAAQGETMIVLATGHRSERFAMSLFGDLDPVCFVEVGDFTGIALRRCAGRGIARVAFVGMAGKISKLAAGIMMTHFHRSDVDVEMLAETARVAGAPPDVVAAATQTATARHFFEVCVQRGCTAPLELLVRRARDACHAHAGGSVEVEVVLVDYEGETAVARV